MLAADTAVARQYSVQRELLNLVLEFSVMRAVVIKLVNVKNHLYLLLAHLDVLGYRIEPAAVLAVLNQGVCAYKKFVFRSYTYFRIAVEYFYFIAIDLLYPFASAISYRVYIKTFG